MITTLALVRLIPTPPALVDRRKTSLFLCGLLYLSIAACLYLALTWPSILSYLYSLYFKYYSINCNIWVNWEKISTFLPYFLHFYNNFWTRTILPLELINFYAFWSCVWTSLNKSCYNSLIKKGWLQHFLSCIYRLFKFVL